MEASPTKVIQFFSGFKQSVIPLFQRRYEWKEANWNTLWEDTLERYEADTPIDHFLGAIVTSPAKSVPVGVSKFLVIDGQQRLTTLALFLCALRDSLPAEAVPQRNRIQKHYLLNEDYEEWDHLKILPTQTNRDEFRAIVEGSVSSAPEESRMREAYEFFKKKIGGRDSEGNPVDPVRLLQVIETRLMVVSINLGETDDPYLIFESLNFKGSPLTQADLVRNYLLMRFPVGVQQRVYNDLWLPMQVRLGESLTEFMRVYLMRQGEEVARGEIYVTLKRRLHPLESEAQVEDELRAMSEQSKSYAVLVQPALEKDEKLRARLERAARLETATAHPLLLAVYDRYRRGELSALEVDSFVGVIESFTMRRFFCDVPTNQLKRIYLSLAKAYLDQAPALWLTDQLRPGHLGRRWPTDDEFHAAWRRFPLYTRHDRCRLVLEVLEADHGHKEQASTVDATIEHVMPQTLTPWWHDHLGSDAKNVQAELSHTVGNLTLSAYNSELSNETFDAKKKLFEESNYTLNGYFSRPDTWSKDSILERADTLFERAVRLWPRPSNPSEET